MYHQGQIIRHKETGQALMVLDCQELYTLVADLRIEGNPTPIYALLSRDYENWVPDLDMEKRITHSNGTIEIAWIYKPLQL